MKCCIIIKSYLGQQKIFVFLFIQINFGYLVINNDININIGCIQHILEFSGLKSVYQRQLYKSGCKQVYVPLSISNIQFQNKVISVICGVIIILQGIQLHQIGLEILNWLSFQACFRNNFLKLFVSKTSYYNKYKKYGVQVVACCSPDNEKPPIWTRFGNLVSNDVVIPNNSILTSRSYNWTQQTIQRYILKTNPFFS
eukprot:TRINITY_DN4607_c0_g1_i11.p2 TRINITY_DN4607_c0_g1~~TRINITY_DN4607_c0_g1_i11.p2  ORF type:complete len:198 (-),score=-12.94 TRINITY_DN4607_c0_g1_i11:1532-2125(-)